MSPIERGFVPLNRAKSERVMFDVKLPSFVDSDKIGVNLCNIEKLCQIGGIRRLAVVGFEDLDTSQTVPQILGINEQGSAYMGKAKTKTVDPSEGYSGTDRGLLNNHALDWTNTVIAINMGEVRSRIANDKKYSEGVRSETAWADYLNKGVKDELSKQGTRHLVFDLTRKQMVWLGIIGAISLIDPTSITVIPFVEATHITTSVPLGITSYILEMRKF